MASHPNRNKANREIPPASPTPDQVRELRNIAGITQTEAAKIIHGALKSWANYEAPEDSGEHRRMPAAAWDLFLVRCRERGVEVPKRYKDYLDTQGGGYRDE